MMNDLTQISSATKTVAAHVGRGSPARRARLQSCALFRKTLKKTCACFIVLLAIGILNPSVASPEEDPLLLVEDGQPAAVILTASGPVARGAARQLQDTIERMSGVKLEVYEEEAWQQWPLQVEGGRLEFADVPDMADRNFILVGTEAIAHALGIGADDLGIGGIRLHYFANGIVLLGGPEQIGGERGHDGGGARYAVIEWLEQMGCRHLWPGELGWVIPEKNTIAVERIDVRYTPPIRSRRIRLTMGGNRDYPFPEPLEQVGRTREQWQQQERRIRDRARDWHTWQRLGGELPTFGHAGAGLRSAINRSGHDIRWFMCEHPGWFALQRDGTRDQHTTSRWRLCKSNPELIEFVADNIIALKNENPALELVSLCPNDGSGVTGWCECEPCRALDPPQAPQVQALVFPERVRSGGTRQRVMIPSLSDRMVYYWNRIAERVVVHHPDLLFGVSAYSRFTHAPVERKLHPNLVVRYVPNSPDRWDGWREAGARRLYWRPNYLLPGRADGKLRVYVAPFAEDIRHFADTGLDQTDISRIRDWWSVSGLNYYAAARLLWNPHLSAEEIIADYARHGFGEGAEYIERYFRRVQELTTGYESDEPPTLLEDGQDAIREGVHRSFSHAADYRYTPEVAAELREWLNRAERAAANDADVVRRIQFLRIGLNYTELQERLTWKSYLAREGEPYDRDLARLLLDLNGLVSRDILFNHPHTIDIVAQVDFSSHFAQYAVIGGRTLEVSDPSLLDRLSGPGYGWTGREQNMKEMLGAFGLEAVSRAQGVPLLDAGDGLDPQAFAPFRAVVITTDPAGRWDEQDVAHIRAWLEEGNTLILAGNALHVLGGNNRNIDLIEPLVGGRRYQTVRQEGRILLPDHPLVQPLDTACAWFSNGRQLGQLTTAQPVIGTEESAVVSVNQVGAGRVIYIAPILSRVDPDERSCLAAVFKAALEMAGVTPVSLEELEAASQERPQVALFGRGRGRLTKDWLIENVLSQWRGED